MLAWTEKNEELQKIEKSVSEIEEFLKLLGYDLLPDGLPVAITKLIEGYSSAEIAAHIAYTTLARDIRESDGSANYKLITHGQSMLKLLEQFRDQEIMRLAEWEHDSKVIERVLRADENQKSWIDFILNDPIARIGRIAKSQTVEH